MIKRYIKTKKAHDKMTLKCKTRQKRSLIFCYLVANKVLMVVKIEKDGYKITLRGCFLQTKSDFKDLRKDNTIMILPAER